MRRLFFGNAGVKDDSMVWSYDEVSRKTIPFTVPPGIKRIKVFANVDYALDEPEAIYSAVIKNTTSNKEWGKGYSEADDRGVNSEHKNIDSVVGVTPGKTYTLYFDCWATSGVTFSWGKAIYAMTPTVEDY